MEKLYTILALILSGIYSWYSGQFILGLTFLLLYVIGMCTVHFIIKSKVSLRIYGLFFIIYGLLLILTQYLFIEGKGIEEAYFNHNDASMSFYDGAVIQLGPNKWNELVGSTLMSVAFGDYPLFSMWINTWKLIAMDWGVSIDNLRLFLRIQDLLFAPGLLAIMARYFKEIGFANKKAEDYCSFFGIFSYLFLTSVVFTRDLHVAFFYTLATYYCLSPIKHRYIYLKLIIIALICFGLRPENGMFATAFPVYYFFRDSRPSIKLFIGGIFVVAFLIGSGILDAFQEAQEGFNEHTAEVTKGGLFSVFNSLPFPLNILFNSIYSFIMPFPLSLYFLQENISWLGLPSIVMPVINLVILIVLFRYIKAHRHNYRILYFFVICVLYMVLCCSVETNVRRTFAAIPPLFMLFSCVKPYISDLRFKTIVKNVIVFLLILNIPAIIYLIIKGRISL